MTTPATAHPTVQEADVVRALTRGGIYRLLGRAFGYPTASVLAELAPLAAAVAGELGQGRRPPRVGVHVADGAEVPAQRRPREHLDEPIGVPSCLPEVGGEPT
jgi:hypothetical protein